MSFLNTFIELSLLDESITQTNSIESQTDILQQQVRLLQQQNELINKQNEGIKSLIQHNQQQDLIRDYIYRINKLCERLELTNDKESLSYYYSLYCIAKGINESGVTTSIISELKDKEFFDNCLVKIGHLLYDFSQKNKEKISDYNIYIRDLDESIYFADLKEYEDIRYKFVKINEIINNYEKVHYEKFKTLRAGIIPTTLCFILCVAFANADLSFLILPCIIISGILNIILVTSLNRKKQSKNNNVTVSRTEYNNSITEQTKLKKKLAEKNEKYEYAKGFYPEFDFETDNDISMMEKIRSTLEEREKQINQTLDLCNINIQEISDIFYVTQ